MMDAQQALESERQINAAIDQVRALDYHMWLDIGPHMTCTEADAIAGLFRAVGLVEQADHLLCGHAAGDDGDDDLHVWIEDEPGWRYVTGLEDDEQASTAGMPPMDPQPFQ